MGFYRLARSLRAYLVRRADKGSLRSKQTYIKPENTILSLNTIDIAIRFNGSWVALMLFAKMATSPLHVQPLLLELTHNPKYPVRTVSWALSTRGVKRALRFLFIPELPATDAFWYESETRYMLGIPGWLEEHPARRSAKKTMEMPKHIIKKF